MIGQLTNHLLQSTLFALAAALLVFAFRKNRAKVRHALWLTASLKFLVPFSMLIALGSQIRWTPAAHEIATRAASHDFVQTVAQFSEPFTVAVPASPRRTDRWLLAIAFLWFCGFACIIIVRVRAWRGMRIAIRRSQPLDLGLPVEARLSSGVFEPGVVGLWRPMLLLPQGIIERLTPSELEAVVAHELCHIRRRDNLFAAVHMLVEALFWFHPFVWWIGARLVDERERACDEEVISLGNHPEIYADAILNICKLYTESPLPCVSGVTGADIRRRLEAILSDRGFEGLSRAKKFLLAGAGMVALAAPVAVGLLIGVENVPVALTQPAVPKFDAVSVRRCMPGDETKGPPGVGRGGGAGRGPRFSPGRLRMQCMTLGDMIGFAYAGLFGNGLLNSIGPLVDSSWLRDAPPWVKSDWYTVDAETDDPVANKPDTPGHMDSEQRMEQMLQLALEDRFQLKIHRDTEEVPMYNLTVAKGGLKLKPMEPGGCFEHDPSKGTFTSEILPPGQKPMCTVWLHKNGPDWALDAAGQKPGNLTGMLANALGRHVFDKTGVTDLYIFHLQFAHDETTPGNLPPGMIDRMFPPTDVPSGPSIFTALEAVGLKLEPTKGPRGFIVVDHVERPSAN
ncbi:MAG TPA: M56 family metallopeptidase [Bryobacteraceae bacterium]|jgi:uncharacterized protein (TIGR03435 family)